MAVRVICVDSMDGGMEEYRRLEGIFNVAGIELLSESDALIAVVAGRKYE